MLKTIASRLSDCCEAHGVRPNEHSGFRPERALRLQTPAFYRQHAVHSTPTQGSRTKKVNTAIYALRQPPEGLRLGRARTDMERTGPGRRTRRDNHISPPIAPRHMLARVHTHTESFLDWLKSPKHCDIDIHCLHRYSLTSSSQRPSKLYLRRSARTRSF